MTCTGIGGIGTVEEGVNFTHSWGTWTTNCYGPFSGNYKRFQCDAQNRAISNPSGGFYAYKFKEWSSLVLCDGAGIPSPGDGYPGDAAYTSATVGEDNCNCTTDSPTVEAIGGTDSPTVSNSSAVASSSLCLLSAGFVLLLSFSALF